MAIPQHLEVIKQGVAAWNKWRLDNPAEEPDLAGANLSKTDLKGPSLGRKHIACLVDQRRFDIQEQVYAQVFRLPLDGIGLFTVFGLVCPKILGRLTFRCTWVGFYGNRQKGQKGGVCQQ